MGKEGGGEDRRGGGWEGVIVSLSFVLFCFISQLDVLLNYSELGRRRVTRQVCDHCTTFFTMPSIV